MEQRRVLLIVEFEGEDKTLKNIRNGLIQFENWYKSYNEDSSVVILYRPRKLVVQIKDCEQNVDDLAFNLGLTLGRLQLCDVGYEIKRWYQ